VSRLSFSITKRLRAFRGVSILLRDVKVCSLLFCGLEELHAVGGGSLWGLLTLRSSSAVSVLRWMPSGICLGSVVCTLAGRHRFILYDCVAQVPYGKPAFIPLVCVSLTPSVTFIVRILELDALSSGFARSDMFRHVN
jgi:hypothetical protein